MEGGAKGQTKYSIPLPKKISSCNYAEIAKLHEALAAAQTAAGASVTARDADLAISKTATDTAIAAHDVAEAGAYQALAAHADRVTLLTKSHAEDVTRNAYKTEQYMNHEVPEMHTRRSST